MEKTTAEPAEPEWLPSAWSQTHWNQIAWKKTPEDWVFDGHLLGFKIPGEPDEEGEPTSVIGWPVQLVENQPLFFDHRPVGYVGEGPDFIEWVPYYYSKGKLVQGEPPT